MFPAMQGKGSGYFATVAHVRAALGDAATDALDVTRAEREALHRPLATAWYDIRPLGKLMEAYAAHLGGGDPRRHIPEFERVGESIAGLHANFIYSALFRWMGAQGAMKFMPRAWSTYFREYELDIERPAGSDYTLYDAHGFSYLGAIASGWMRWALRKTGKDNVTVRERRLYDDGDIAGRPMVFDIRW